MAEIDVEALEKEIDEVDIDLDEIIQAVTDPDAFYARNTFRVVYQTNAFLLPQIRDLISERRVINIRPEYQRRSRWTTKQKSRLIESLLLNIPIPPVFFFEGEAARYEVMDGQQRLSAIKEFMANEFNLTGLEVMWPLNGMSYAACPPRIKRGLDRALISVVILLLESESQIPGDTITKNKDIRRFIFERLNTGGTRLNAQELRNAIYPSPFGDAIISMARNPIFTKIWGIPAYTESDPSDYYENPKRQKNRLYASMADCQIVLRFFALRQEKNIRGSMKGILDRTMEIYQPAENHLVEVAQAQYIERLKLAYELFDGRPFELPADTKGKARLSISLYDAVMIAIDRLWDRRALLIERASEVRSAVNDLMQDHEKAQVITGRGNTAQYIKDRIALVEKAISAAAEK